MLTAISIPVGAQEKTDTLRMSLFYKTGSPSPEPQSRKAAENVLYSLPDEGIHSVLIEGWSSPDGSEATNLKVAGGRAASALNFVKQKLPVSDDKIETRAGIDWQGVYDFTPKHMPAHASAVRDIINSTPPDGGQRSALLMNYSNGAVWSRLMSELFPLLRRADITIIYDHPKPQVTEVVKTEFVEKVVEIEKPVEKTVEKVVNHVEYRDRAPQRDTLVIFHRDTVYYMPDPSVYRNGHVLRTRGFFKWENNLRRPVLALRSNLLLPLLNFGLEVPINNRWSVAADLYYPWAPRSIVNHWAPANSYCVQGLGGYLEGRLWLGQMHRNDVKMEKYRLLGHSIALVAAGGYYDWQMDWAGHQGEAYALGLDYMYACPLGKKNGVHLEFDIAVGVVYVQRHPYMVHDAGGYLIREKDENNMPVRNLRNILYGVPMKAGVTLVVPFRTDQQARPKEGATK